MTFEDKSTPKLCLNICLQLGYKYSGVEYGFECYCGNRRPNSNQEVGENHCAMPCPGDRKKNCGGGWRILVYSTNVGTPNNFQSFTTSTTSTTTTTRRPTIRTTTTRRQTQTQRPVVQQTTARPSHTTQRTTPRPQQQGNLRPNQIQASTSTYKPVMLSSTSSSSGNGNKNGNNHNANNNNKQTPGKNCIQSTTVVNGKTVCRGEMVFKDDFVNAISNDKWTYEVKMPWIPDYEFIIFQKKEQNAFIKNGKLYLKPTLLEDEFVRRGRLELHRCTGMPYSEECVRQAATFSILPPIEAARINTKDSITFKYGIIQVRAKLPLGDWIIPEIWLEPKRKLYGPSYASGRIRIAMARGNKNLLAGDQDIGNRQLESGVLMGVGENIRGRTIIRDKIDGWHKHFHNYTLIWTPDNLQFLVDGQHEESIMNPGTTLAELVEFDENTAITWKSGTRIAPFDQEFYLSLGISVGGMRDFPDESTSAGHEKPWRNLAVKALLNFWQDRHHWRNTWDDERSALQIEHVRIKAL
uniref:Putative beta-1 n=1 Tax=Triatoma infestans TaxID=30076 RepID=A0A023F500_TRIIF